jgi:hypothetical protein
VGKDRKAKPKPALQRCWRDGSPMEYRAVGAGQPQRKELDPHSESDTPMMIGDQCEILDDFDVGIYSGGPLSKHGQRHVHTTAGVWVSTRRNAQKPVTKVEAKPTKKGAAKKKGGGKLGGSIAGGGSDKKKAPPPKKKAATKKKLAPKGRKAEKSAAARSAKGQPTQAEPTTLAMLDRLAVRAHTYNTSPLAS